MKILSVSRLKTLLTCPKKYWHQYINKTPEPFTGDALILGSAVHHTIEEFFKSGKQLDVEAFFHNEYDKLVNEAELKGCPIQYGDWSNYKDNISRGTEMVSKFLKRKEVYDLSPSNIYNEVPFVLSLGNFFDEDWYLHGIIDAIIQDGDRLVVADFKTTKAKVEKWFTENDLQLVGYAYSLMNGFPIVSMDHWKETKQPNEELTHLFGNKPDLVEYIALHSQASSKKPWQVAELRPHPFKPTEQKLKEWRHTMEDLIQLLHFYESSGCWIKNLKDPTTTPCSGCAFNDACWGNLVKQDVKTIKINTGRN